MATIKYTIVGGTPNYTATLRAVHFYLINTHTVGGTYQFNNVPNDTYLLSVNDANECMYEQTLTVNPLVTTTTTTLLPDDALIVGNAQDQILIFDPSVTNTDNPFVGNPDPNTIPLYLWFQTKNGKPLTTSKQISYTILSGVIGTEFTYTGVSDDVYATVVQTSAGPTSNLTGKITFGVGFIETYFAYTFKKLFSPANYGISLTAPSNVFDPDIPTINTPPTYLYGVNIISPTGVNMIFA